MENLELVPGRRSRESVGSVTCDMGTMSQFFRLENVGGEFLCSVWPVFSSHPVSQDATATAQK